MTGSNGYAGEQPIPIGEVARMFGVTVPTVRNWEKAGKISSTRSPGGQRRFAPAEVRALLQDSAVAS